jgi:hypothetical protein
VPARALVSLRCRHKQQCARAWRRAVHGVCDQLTNVRGCRAGFVCVLLGCGWLLSFCVVASFAATAAAIQRACVIVADRVVCLSDRRSGSARSCRPPHCAMVMCCTLCVVARRRSWLVRRCLTLGGTRRSTCTRASSHCRQRSTQRATTTIQHAPCDDYNAAYNVQHAADLAIAGLVLGDTVHGAARLWDEDAPAAPADPFYLRLERLPSSSLTIFLEAVKVQANRIVVVRTLVAIIRALVATIRTLVAIIRTLVAIIRTLISTIRAPRNGSFVPSHPRW